MKFICLLILLSIVSVTTGQPSPIVITPRADPSPTVESLKDDARRVLDPAASFPQPISLSMQSFSQLELSTQLTSDSFQMQPLSEGNHFNHSLACSIPSAPRRLSRSQVLQSLAHDIASSLDLTTNPCDNFYQFACGGWLARFNESSIPPTEASWSKSFSEIDKRNMNIVREILDCNRQKLVAANPSLRFATGNHSTLIESHHLNQYGDDEEVGSLNIVAGVEGNASFPQRADLLPHSVSLLGTFYAACMDQPRIDSLGLRPLQDLLTSISRINNLTTLMTTIGRLSRTDSFNPFFSMGIAPDSYHPLQYQIAIGQGGYPFASREMLVGPSNVSGAYQQYIQQMLALAGFDDDSAQITSNSILQFQTALANMSVSVEEMRTPESITNQMTISFLELETSHQLDFASFFQQALHNTSIDASSFMINVLQPSLFRNLSSLLSITPLSTIKSHMLFMALNSFASDLPRSFGRANFEFFGKTLAGTKRLQPRWKVCQSKALSLLQDPLSNAFMNVSFSPDTESEVREMLRFVEQAFSSRLDQISWMAEQDKIKAKRKLEAMLILVGATKPSHQLSYGNVQLSPVNHLRNMKSLNAYLYEDALSRLYQPVDRERFQMYASQVNAYYDPTLNSMNFPAGIIQPPFFSPEYPREVLYGGLGSVMGHELTHGFDDEGRKYDETGALHPWWSTETTSNFSNATKCLEQQYSDYQLRSPAHPKEQLHIRGFLTLGENLADQGGVQLSALALKQKEQNTTNVNTHEDTSMQSWMLMQEAEPSLRQFSRGQLFSISYAQGWCRTVREEALVRTLMHDPHSPAEARVNIPLLNSQLWRDNFHCPPPPTQYQRCTIW